MDCQGAKEGSDVTRPPLIHSVKSAVKAIHLPSRPPTAPLPPIPTKESLSTVSTLTTSRPATMMTHHLKKPIKYGTGKYEHVELIPQPSDDPEDPLNWPRWKKELSLLSLFVMVGLIGAMKTAFVSTNTAVASRYRESYPHIAALTAVPLMVSALTGLLSTIMAKLRGKRPVYLVSAVLVSIGCVWNTTARSSYASCLGARVMQGLGWGAFDALLMESIQDMYFEHERSARVTLYSMLAATTTWGSPVIGGAISHSIGSFTVQYHVMTALLLLLALPLLLLGAPETTFNRARAAPAPTPTPHSAFADFKPPLPESAPTIRITRRSIKPCSFYADLRLSTVVRVLRAFAAPTTLLVFLLTLTPHVALWTLASSLAALLAPFPAHLRPSIIGTFMAGPWLLSLLVLAGLYSYRANHAHAHTQLSRPTTFVVIAGASVLAIAGLVTFGLHKRHSEASLSPQGEPRHHHHHLRLPLFSLQLGLVAAGSYALDATARPLLARSVSFTASSLAVAQCSVGTMHSCLIVLRNLAAGALLLAMPHIISAPDALLHFVMALGVAHAVLTLVITALWHFRDECLWKLDGRAMGLLDLSLLRLCGSY